ncbi:ATP-binding protein, partial [Streptomyces sp. SID3212]|uniref:AAA family ATPase n=1 Tax=Streptomyces sp. SID3212 TaxID=2690259 RepID=UPI00136F3896|nr:AAA family ATPase [Streptomyces sp. SID3212]
MRQYRSPLVGRHDEVGDVARALRATGAAVRTLLVSGAAGAGKTALLHEARRAAAKKGAKVLRLGWEVAEEPAGAAALADAVCGVLAKIHDGRILARVTVVRRAQSRSVGRGGEVALLSALGEVLADAARQVPFALVVDDADRMPDATASALGLLLRAFRPAGVPVVLAGRPMIPGQAGGGGQLLAAADRVVELPALSSAEVGELIVRRLDRPVEPQLVTAVLRALGPLAGSPGAVLSVLASLEECGGLLELDGQVCLTVPEDELRLTPDAAELGRLGWPHASPDAETLDTATTLARLTGQAELRLDDLHPVGPVPLKGPPEVGVWGGGSAGGGPPWMRRRGSGLRGSGLDGSGLYGAGPRGVELPGAEEPGIPDRGAEGPGSGRAGPVQPGSGCPGAGPAGAEFSDVGLSGVGSGGGRMPDAGPFGVQAAESELPGVGLGEAGIPEAGAVGARTPVFGLPGVGLPGAEFSDVGLSGVGPGGGRIPDAGPAGVRAAEFEPLGVGPGEAGIPDAGPAGVRAAEFEPLGVG